MNKGWTRWVAVAAALAALTALACRAEPTPRNRKGGGAAQERGGAVTGGYEGAAESDGTGVPTACTDSLMKGGLPLGNAPRKGSSDPLVAVVEFANFECLDCAKAQAKMDEILSRYPQDVALYFVNVEGAPTAPPAPGQPMPPRGWRLAAQASLAAAQNGKFWEFAQRAFASQGKIAQPDLEQYAQQVGVDLNAFRAQLNNRAVLDQVESGQAIALDLGIRGPLPAFWVNGALVPAADVEARLTQVIEDKLREARQELSAPRARCEVLTRYVTTRQMAAGRAAPQLQRPQRPQEDPNAVYRIPVGDSPVRGAADALATLVLFTDFQCPFCSRVTPTLDELLKAYPTDLRIVYKNMPLPGHSKAGPAAMAAMAAAAQGKFWEYHDKLFANQQALERADLERYAEELGLNMTEFRKALDENAYQAKIQADQELARKFNIGGTPTFTLNGRKFSGALPLDQFKARVDQAIAEAKKLVDAGVPRAAVYDKLMANASDQAVFLPMPAGAEGAPAQGGPPQPPPGPPPLPSEVKDPKVETWNPTRGNADAQMTVVLFCEYLCPFCKRVQPTLDLLAQTYGARIRFVFRNLIIHGEVAETPALAAFAAAKQGKFDAFHKLMFEHQSELRDRTAIEGLAQQLGLDMTRFRADMDSPEARAHLEADKAEGARLGASGTPTLFLNGRMMVGARPPSHFGAWVDQMLGITTPSIPASADAAQGAAPSGGCGVQPSAPPPPPPAAALPPAQPPALAIRPTPVQVPRAVNEAAPRPRPRPATPPAAPADENPY